MLQYHTKKGENYEYFIYVKEEYIKAIFDYIKLILISIVVILIYDGISYNITHQIYTRGTKSVYMIEMLLIIIIITIFYFPKIKNNTLKYIFPTLPVIGLYILFDIFYSFLLRSPRLSDTDNFITIYDFNPALFFSILAFIFFIFFVVCVVLLKIKNQYTQKDFILNISARLSILLLIIMFLQTEIFQTYHKIYFKNISWSHRSTIRKNGKMSSFIYYSNMEIKNKKLLDKKYNVNINKVLYKENIKQKQNIYYIVLESFINPNYIENMIFSSTPTPLYHGLKKYLKDGKFSNIISPVYGGGTAQAEFELLTGIKAFAKFNTNEFNVLTGASTNTFLSKLKENNYTTIATIATHSGFFNSRSAYQSLGFDKSLFLKEVKDYKKNKNDKIIFDGDLYSYNITIIKKMLKKSNKPFFNYVLGMYGHNPYKRNKKDRPDMIDIKNRKNHKIEKITNQFYYRTKALTDYIDEILLLDPNSIIFVSSDHIPAILDNNVNYKYDRHVNIALLLNAGKPVKISKKHQYQIPWFIWDILSKSKTKRDLNDTMLEKLYLKALQDGVQ